MDICCAVINGPLAATSGPPTTVCMWLPYVASAPHAIGPLLVIYSYIWGGRGCGSFMTMSPITIGGGGMYLT